MAATNKQTDSSCFPSSSSSKLWDVFLSFGGKDTRRGFIGHLYSALDQAGIRTFKDEPGLERGEEIAPQLIKAIHDSKMSIVVFSENYASSKWCLTELAEILECERTKGHIVLPVFYDVDPLNVRHQIESYAKAFEKHKIRYAEKVETWKAALTTTANISGYDLKNDANGHEADLIQKIVSDVLIKIPPKDMNVTKHPVGIDSRIKKIRQKLSIGSNDVRFIGIYGMAGIGKTTIAKALYNKIYKDFEGSCFLENDREPLGEPPRGLHYLLEQLISELLKLKDFKVRSVDEGISFVKQRLRSKKVLIVLDNLDEVKQLESLAGKWNWFGPGSRIIVTTRNSRLLDEFQVDLRHEVKELDHNESLELFRRHAFKNITPMKNLQELSKDIVSYVGGVPLALEVLGSSLFDRDMVYWVSFFKKLKKIPHEDIQKKLKISYDALDNTEREIFLDIACFFIGMDKDDASKILDACGSFPDIGISILRERCLLTINWEKKLRMHNLIRDMGREIVREESVKNPRKRSRLWFHEDAYDVLKKFKGDEKIEGISLVMPMQEEVHISTRAFKSLPNLRLLQISNVNLTGSFEDLFEELRWFCWYGCSLDCLPSSFQAPKLVFLDMQHSKVKILWKGTKQLQSLKILNASGSHFLKTTPDFKGLESLEKLILQGCSCLSRIHPSIGLLHKLVQLDLKGCDRLNQLPEQLGNMGCLRMLDASLTSIEQLPDSIGNLGKLVQLDLKGCDRLNQLPEQLGNMGCLRKLDASLTSIEQLPDSIGNLGKLEELSLFGCKKLRNLPSSICDLTSLTSLELFRTNIMHLPDSIGHLGKLEDLNLLACEKLRNLPGSICDLTSLMSLDLDYCSNLESLPKNFGNLTSLSALNLSETNIMQLPDSIGCCLTRLESLHTSRCKRLRNTPRSIYNLSSLEYLSLSDWSENVVSLSSLKDLSLTNEYSISLPSNLSQLVNLEFLDVSGCSSLQSLPELPPNLQELGADSCTSLDKLPNLSRMNNLRSLYFSKCSSLQSLPGLPPFLSHLFLNNCSSLESLPELPPNLNDLDLIDCTSLRSLPKLPCNLGYLKLSYCSSLESLQELHCRLSDLTNLRSLILKDCSNLISNFIWSFLQDCSGLDGCDVYLPSRVIPDWFRHQTMGSSISFQIPLEVKSNFSRMAVGLIFRAKYNFGIEAVITNKTDGSQFRYYVSTLLSNGVYSCVRFMGKSISMKSGDRIEVSFRGSGDVTVEMCGVHFDCKRVRDVDVEEICSFKRLKTLGIGIFQKLLGG